MSIIKVLVKVHHYQNSSVLAICDPDLLGKEVRDGKRCLKIREKFYAGILTDVEDALQLLKSHDNINLIGLTEFITCSIHNLQSARTVVSLSAQRAGFGQNHYPGYIQTICRWKKS